ncbi:MAG: diguanylate cyclase, partial [Gallionella sp.]|nr:diguanylate cyclase [Gallionella sp.]
MTLTRKIGFLLLLPVFGALATLGIYFALHTHSAEDAPVINLAGRQRLHAQQLLAYAGMVRAGQTEDRAALLELTKLYERALTVLEHGGEFMGQVFPSAPVAAQNKIAEIRQLWNEQAAALRLIAENPPHGPGAENAYRAVQLNTPLLVAAADNMVTAITQYNQAEHRREMKALIGLAGFNFLLLLAGVFITRQYVAEQKRTEGMLREAAERRRLLMETANDAIFIADTESGILVECNKKASELIGLPPEQIVGLHQSELHPPEQAEQYRQKFRDNIRAEGAVIKDVLVQHRSGRRIPVEISASTLELDGKTYVQGIFRDVSERQRMDKALRALAASAAGHDFLNILVCQLGMTLETDYALVAENLDGLTARTVAVCAHGKIVDNFEYPLRGTPCYNVLNGKFCHHPNNVAREFPEDKLLSEMQVESYMGMPLIDAGGRTLGLLAVLGRRPLANPEFAESIFQVFAARAANELERKHAEQALHENEERLQHMAHYDHLTHLPNRVLFLDRLEQALARARWHKRLAAVLYLDLDRFKVINDTVGHPIGDRVLKVIAERLNAAVREGDTVARVGGDEFAVALADLAEAHDVPRLAEKLIAALGPPVVIDEREYFVTASIGVSLHPGDGDDAETLLRNADVAMYRAKEKGKNNFQFYSPAMNAEAP